MVSFIGGWNRTTRRKPLTYTATHWKTVSHNVVSNTPDLSGIRTHNTFCHISTLLESWCKLNVDIPSMLYFHLISFALYQHLVGFGLWCLTQYFSYIMAVSFINEWNRSTRRKPPTYRKSLTNFITLSCFIEYTSPERDSNSQRFSLWDIGLS